jgi:aminoglycoside/choline kinase family phosphotransferase
MADHGLKKGKRPQEVDAFIDIGRHLHRQRIAVPELVAWDRFAGLAFIQDLGDTHLQAMVKNTDNSEKIATLYQLVIDEWVRLATTGHDGFDPNWTHQTPCYDVALVLEKECRYFVDAFLIGYLGMDKAATEYQADFEYLAGRIMAHAINGLIHRDCQSRNIMVKDQRIYFIDFQGARSGPVQYDLASLLIDPYVALPAGMQQQLCEYAFEQLSRVTAIDRHPFFAGYRYCALSRNLQILGAFGFLTRVKGKPQFKAYIPAAVHSLGRCLDAFKPDEFPALKSVLDCIKMEGITPKTNRRSSI